MRTRLIVRSATLLTVGAMLAIGACGGHNNYPSPVEPEAAVRRFMDGVQANNLDAMADVWGSERGPTKSFRPRDEVNKRLTVMQRYLVNDRWEFVTGNLPTRDDQGRPMLHVRLYRNGCTPVVPFTMARYGRGWLVWEVGLAAAGTPGVCQGANQ